MASVEFWFEFASTYSYLSAARARAVCTAAQLELVYRPFLLGPIFADEGLTDSPFNLQPRKGRYMWRDVERLATGYGLPFRKPSRFPRNGLAAARIATAARDEKWLPAFVENTYRANFAEDCDIADRAELARLVSEAGGDAEWALAAADMPDTKRALREATDRARELGIFGAPSFVVGEELFWGNDRLGDAVAWARLGPT